MKGQRNTPEYWIHLVEQHFYLGNDFALIPANSLPEETAIELADRLDVLLERWDDEYIFQQKKHDVLAPGPGEAMH
ncbi:MAG: hypothetical protein V4628_15515 [Pseudomonadota bacterium]